MVSLYLCKPTSITFAKTWNCLSWCRQAGLNRFISFECWLRDKVGCLFPAVFPPALVTRPRPLSATAFSPFSIKELGDAAVIQQTTSFDKERQTLTVSHCSSETRCKNHLLLLLPAKTNDWGLEQQNKHKMCPSSCLQKAHVVFNSWPSVSLVRWERLYAGCA